MDDTRRIVLVDFPASVGSSTMTVPLIRYQYSNHIESAALELDDSGNVISYEEPKQSGALEQPLKINLIREKYYPFGGLSYYASNSTINAVAKRYKYSGKEKDEEPRRAREYLILININEQTGLYYFGARYHAPWLGRFISVDPKALEYLSISSFIYVANNPINAIDPDGQDIVYLDEGGNEVNRIANEKVNKTFVIDINAKFHQTEDLDGNGGKGWIEAKMPNIIRDREGASTLEAKYQKYDYLIAAMTSYFNQYKNKGKTPTHTNEYLIDNPKTIPDLDPTLVKAIIMQETSMGTIDPRTDDSNDSKSDIMQANVYYSDEIVKGIKQNDWNESKIQFGLKKQGGAIPELSVKAGIGILYQKGLVTKNDTTTFQGWEKATFRYNASKNAEAYKDNVERMENQSFQAPAGRGPYRIFYESIKAIKVTFKIYPK